MMMILIVRYDSDCGTLLCSMFVFFGSMKYYYSAYLWQ